MRILAIETSCDETGAAIIEAERDNGDCFKILSNQLSSQIKVHQKYGGVVPNLAKREHQKNLIPLLKSALKNSGLLKLKTSANKRGPKMQFKIKKEIEHILSREPELLIQTKKLLEKYKKPKINAIAATCGPGLEPALWVGVNFAKALTIAWKLPIIKINHLEGHFLSFLLSRTKIQKKQIKNLFPILGLLVSGGHTELIYSPSLLKYKLIGETLDDAAGEAFDKGARLLGLPYPGGALLSKLAEKGNPRAFDFPRPMINSEEFNFSFAGLKTAFLYQIQKLKDIKNKTKADLSASFQQAIIDVLTEKTIKAIRKYKPRTLIIGGGVAANELLRFTLKEKITKEFPDINLFFPEKELTTDNAAMIALSAYFHYLKKDFANPAAIKAEANLRLRFEHKAGKI